MTDNKINRESCYVCGSVQDHVLERHHIVPKRLGGLDTSPNLVDVCPTCHRVLENLYGSRFYARLGVEEVKNGRQYYEELIEQEISEYIEPGSTFQSVSYRIARDLGVIDYACDGCLVLGPYKTGESGNGLVCVHCGESNEANKYKKSLIDESAAEPPGSNVPNNIVGIRQWLADLIADLEEDHDGPVPIPKIRSKASDSGATENEIDAALKLLRQRGEVYEPRTGRLRRAN